jgi:hypothetical protein
VASRAVILLSLAILPPARSPGAEGEDSADRSRRGRGLLGLRGKRKSADDDHRARRSNTHSSLPFSRRHVPHPR